MSRAAVEAEVLRDGARQTPDFQRRVVGVVRDVWPMATSADFRFLEVMHMHRRPLQALADPRLLAAMLDPTR